MTSTANKASKLKKQPRMNQPKPLRPRDAAAIPVIIAIPSHRIKISMSLLLVKMPNVEGNGDTQTAGETGYLRVPVDRSDRYYGHH